MTVKVLQSDSQIPEKTVTETSTELVLSLEIYKSISEITDSKLTSDCPHLLSTESGNS